MVYIMVIWSTAKIECESDLHRTAAYQRGVYPLSRVPAWARGNAAIDWLNWLTTTLQRFFLLLMPTKGNFVGGKKGQGRGRDWRLMPLTSSQMA